MSEAEKSKVPSLTKTMRILDLLIEHGKCTVRDFLKQTNISRSSLYILLNEMELVGLIKHDDNGFYTLWMKAIQIGDAASKHLNFSLLARPYLKSLMEKTNCLTAYFGVVDGDKAFFAEKLSNSKMNIQTKSALGTVIDFVHAGIGKCLLAFQPQEVQERLFKSLDFTPITKNSITSLEGLQIELQKIRDQGWSFNNSEDDEEIKSIAAPVFGKDDSLFGAISIVGTLNQLTNKNMDAWVKAIKACANEVSYQLH